MPDPTPLDLAHAAMTDRPEDLAARMAYYHRLADTELCLVLTREPAGDRLDPRILALDDGRFALAFDGEDRLAAFARQPVPYAALPGRAAVLMLAGTGLGLGLNLGAGAGAFLMPADAVDWLAAALADRPAAAPLRPVRWQAPAAPALAGPLADALSALGGAAAGVWLAAAQDADGRLCDVLLAEAAAGAPHEPLARALAEAAAFAAAGAEPPAVMVVDAAALARIGPQAFAVRVALATPAAAAPAPARQPPGSDPARPPRLR